MILKIHFRYKNTHCLNYSKNVGTIFTTITFTKQFYSSFLLGNVLVIKNYIWYNTNMMSYSHLISLYILDVSHWQWSIPQRYKLSHIAHLKLPFTWKDADPLVVVVSDDDVTVGVDGHTCRPLELTWSPATDTKPTFELAVIGENLKTWSYIF